MQIKHALIGALATLALAGAPLQAGEDRAADKASADGRMEGSLGARLPVSEVIGKKVTNAQGEDLGEVNDLVLDLRDGRVRYAILEFGGIAGLREKLFAYPVSAFRLREADGGLVLNVDQSQLAGAEGFDRDRFPPGNDPYWARADRAQGRTPSAAAGASAGAGAPPGEIAPPEFVRASRVIGSEVEDTAGGEEAEVKELFVDLRDGRIHQFVLENDGRSLNLPMRQISAAGRGHDLRLRADLPQSR